MSIQDVLGNQKNVSGTASLKTLIDSNASKTKTKATLRGGLSSIPKPDLTTSEGLKTFGEQSGLGERIKEIESEKGESPQKIFSGGFISDTFDVLNTLQYGVTGALQGEGFSQGVKSRASFIYKGNK